jgi:hypothetical protein
VRETANQRNLVCNEYYKGKINMNEKKNKKLILDTRLWDFDPEMVKYLNVDPEVAKQNPEIAKRLFFAEVGLSGDGQTEEIRRHIRVFKLYGLQRDRAL